MKRSNLLQDALSNNLKLVETALENLEMFKVKTEQTENCFYSLNAGGKRIRPFLVNYTCLALGGIIENSLPAACAVEMIHTYSLIHDDLPGMDNDNLRRGKPTLHTLCGTEKALFAGDRLLIEAFRELLRTPLPEETVTKMLDKLISAAGPSFLVGGQFMDMFHPSEANRSWTEKMINGKTSAMLRVSMELGGIAANISEDQLVLISSIGNDIGWLFQLTDDILDVVGTEEEMGKSVAKDADMGKWNPINELGLAGAQKYAKDMSGLIINQLNLLDGDWAVLRELVKYLPERRK